MRGQNKITLKFMRVLRLCLGVPESSSMALLPCSLTLPHESTESFFSASVCAWRFSSPYSFLALAPSCSFSRELVLTSKSSRRWLPVKSKPEESEVVPDASTFTEFKRLLLPVIDRNPYLSEGTKQATATTAALAKKYGADITVIVIDEKEKESLSEHETQLASIRWHLSEGGFQEFKLVERLGEGNKPTAILGEVADDMNMDLVVMSMEAIHSKHIDANLLVEFIPCPVLLLPL